MAQHMHPGQLSPRSAVRSPTLIFPPSQWCAQETGSSPAGGVTLASKRGREAKEVVLCPAPGQRQGTEPIGSWEAEGIKSQGEGAEEG